MAKKTPLSQRDMKSDFEVYTFQTLQRSPERDLSLILKSERARKHPGDDRITTGGPPIDTTTHRVTSSGQTRITSTGEIRVVAS